MTPIRYILTVLVAFLVIAVGAAAAMLALIDLNTYRAEIGNRVEAATGRKLVIDGDLKADILSLTPSVVMNDVGLANASWGTRPEMIRIRRLDLAVELLPLLSGDIEVRRLVLFEPDVLLETGTDGVGNWVFDRAGEDTADEPQPGRLPLVGEIVIEDAAITYRDGRTGQVLSGTMGDAVLRGTSANAPLTLAAEGSLDDEPVRIDAELDPLAALIEGETYGAKLDVALGASDFRGTVDVALRAVPPHITADLASRRLDLDALTGGTGPAGGPGSRLFDDAPIPFALLKVADITLDYSADELILAGQAVADASGKLRLRGGQLLIPDLVADLAGGRVDASLGVDANTDPATMRFDATLKGADLATVTGAMAAGPLDLAVRGSGAGRSLAEIMGTMTGRASANVGNGRIDDAVLDFLSADLLSAMQPWASNERGVILNCGVVDFAVEDGVARRRVLLVDTNRAYIVGRRGGTVSLRSESMDLLLDPFTKRTSVATLVAVPLRVSGPLENPSVTPDPGAALSDVAWLPFDVVGSVIGGAVGTIEGIVSGGSSGGEANYCARARAAVERGALWPEETGKGAGRGGLGGAVEEGIEGIGESIKGIFD